MSLSKVSNRFNSRKLASKQQLAALDRSGLLATAHVITTTDELRNYPNTRAKTRRRLKTELETTPEMSLCPKTMAACFKEIRRGTAAMCFNRIRGELKNVDLVFMLGKEELGLTSQMQRYVGQKYRPFLDDALLTYFAIGIIPVLFVRNPNNDEVYPRVPKFGSYNITVQTTLGQPEYKFYWCQMASDGESVPQWNLEKDETNIGNQGRWVARGVVHSDGSCTADGTGRSGYGGMGNHDPTVAIIANLGYDPDINGRINSVMASILEPYINYTTSMRRDATVAGARAARPTLTTEYNAALDTVMSKKSLEIGHFVGSGVLKPGAEGNAERKAHIYQRTLEQQEAQRDQYRMIAATMGETALEQYGVTMDDLKSCDRETSKDFNSELGTDEIMIRDDRKVVRGMETPSFRSDIIPAMRANDESICAAFGLTLSSLNGETSSNKTGTELGNKILNTTIRETQKTFSEVLTTVYNHTFLEGDIFELLADRVRTGAGEALLRPEQLFSDNAAALDVRVTFRFTPMMSIDTLKYLKGRGVLGWKKFATSAVQTVGLDASDIDALDDPLDEDVGRALDIPDYVKIMQLKATEKLEKEKMKNSTQLEEKKLEHATDMKERDIEAAKEAAKDTEQPAAKKAKKKE